MTERNVTHTGKDCGHNAMLVDTHHVSSRERIDICCGLPSSVTTIYSNPIFMSHVAGRGKGRTPIARNPE